MCGRFTLTWDEWRRVAEALRIDDDSEVAASYRPRFNIAVTTAEDLSRNELAVRPQLQKLLKPLRPVLHISILLQFTVGTQISFPIRYDTACVRVRRNFS